jgi:galactokinase
VRRGPRYGLSWRSYRFTPKPYRGIIGEIMKRHIEELLDDSEFFFSLFGDDQRVVRDKSEMLRRVWNLFKDRFSDSVERKNLFLISVPNRVELLGKHTDYQGGETLVFAGPKNFFSLSGCALDGPSELMNADRSFGTTSLRLGDGTLRLLGEGVGSRYSRAVAARLLANLSTPDLPSHRDVKTVFCGDIPFGGGTSGSSSKIIMDFLIFSASSGILHTPRFASLLRHNALKAGMMMNQPDADDFLLPLSMYLAHYENGLDFGDLRGDRGVGTFGGSEDHTAILLGQKDRVLYCRFCPTEVRGRLPLPESLLIVVAYSGKKAEKTKGAMARYNDLSSAASAAVERLNLIEGRSRPYLRDFFQELPAAERAERARTLLSGAPDLARRAYQFYREQAIVSQAAECLSSGRLEELGVLINRSHDLSRDFLNNIVPEIELLQKSACDLGALGASGFGAGFGGSCYALIRREQCDGFIGEWRNRYLEGFPELEGEARFDPYPPCGGVYIENVSGE